MPTHQSLGGASAEQLLLRMVTTHSERYGQDYWGAFDAGVAPHLPASPGVIDLGCGPPLSCVTLPDATRRRVSTATTTVALGSRARIQWAASSTAAAVPRSSGWNSIRG